MVRRKTITRTWFIKLLISLKDNIFYYKIDTILINLNKDYFVGFNIVINKMFKK